ncbi:MAG: hypothetical protein [Wendovervirus sonii]|uniref:DUF551 domain-containing protein n=1 Tax=phage Lak_Megaphage_Sonny TaxID=3109229 RepID=A0ABZ0Z702_9CAUD|nr:MAG: hypothetical protein [phage Lak_Megaphage_Sonny]
MTNKQIIDILTQTVGYKKDFVLGAIGSSLSKDEFDKMGRIEYLQYYIKMRNMIESLPWISVKDKLPECDGQYLTLLDCNEHEIDNNWYKDKTWGWCRTHVQYWMPIPEDNDNEITYIPSKMDWKDGGMKL